jgi:uncharacterized protein (UPF0276 family)
MQNEIQKSYPVSGSGLGLRRDLLDELENDFPQGIDFMEVAPENWIGIGGKLGKRFRALTEKVPFVTHGLSLSIGSPAPLDEKFVSEVKSFLDKHNIRCYSEHLSYCSDQGHLYDLMPIPFTDEAVHYVADRIKRVQDILERKIAIENVSYYAAPGKEMDEIHFIKDILEEADCDLLLDVNNIYVNSVNHHYDPMKFLAALPSERVAYCHVAGHYNEAEDLIVDTHGADVIDPVWDILDKTYELFGNMPTLLERDFNFPPMNELMQEVHTIRDLQNKWDNNQSLAAQAS